MENFVVSIRGQSYTTPRSINTAQLYQPGQFQPRRECEAMQIIRKKAPARKAQRDYSVNTAQSLSAWDTVMTIKRTRLNPIKLIIEAFPCAPPVRISGEMMV